ncbi:hypothetical protein Mnod_0554 [Methylobacterium nodulans ORS 2060]|uniref:Uncharacterized protein n=1 Tax=Methylobacterium nodulans (strain LMG 21967 / CNCM I-2342 / ORS 2060) TaxID=460265 RepID=B8IDM0_METNO|nr:hypothetical protein Mnod_0554 [Methylobacterium nodulans ORS 2060]
MDVATRVKGAVVTTTLALDTAASATVTMGLGPVSGIAGMTGNPQAHRTGAMGSAVSTVLIPMKSRTS